MELVNKIANLKSKQNFQFDYTHFHTTVYNDTKMSNIPDPIATNGVEFVG